MKKFFLIIFILLLLFSLSACSLETDSLSEELIRTKSQVDSLTLDNQLKDMYINFSNSQIKFQENYFALRDLYTGVRSYSSSDVLDRRKTDLVYEMVILIDKLDLLLTFTPDDYKFTWLDELEFDIETKTDLLDYRNKLYQLKLDISLRPENVFV